MKQKISPKEWKMIQICRDTGLGLGGQVCALNKFDPHYNIMELVAKLAPKCRPIQPKRKTKEGKKV